MNVEVPVYKVLSVPIYLYPTPEEIMKIREKLVKKYGTVKKAREILRKKYRCFLSENAIWKRARIQHVDGYMKSPSDPKLSILVVMARGTKSLSEFDYFEYLRMRNIKINPYRTTNSNKPCFGFYCKSYEELHNIVNELGEKKLIDGAMIVNAVWYLDIGKPIIFSNLLDSGYFIPSLGKFKVMNGYVEYAKVTLFHTGKIRIVHALTPEKAKEIAGKTYYILVQNKAVEGLE